MNGARVKKSLEGKLVLVTDDEPDVTTYLRALLEDHGYRVITAHDGDDCLSKARQENPDLITLDITMPGKSGIRVMRDLREPLSGSPDIPICIVTGIGELRRLLVEHSVGAPEGIMKKPIDAEGFLGTVERILMNRDKAKPN